MAAAEGPQFLGRDHSQWRRKEADHLTGTLAPQSNSECFKKIEASAWRFAAKSLTK